MLPEIILPEIILLDSDSQEYFQYVEAKRASASNAEEAMGLLEYDEEVDGQVDPRAEDAFPDAFPNAFDQGEARVAPGSRSPVRSTTSAVNAPSMAATPSSAPPVSPGATTDLDVDQFHTPEKPPTDVTAVEFVPALRSPFPLDGHSTSPARGKGKGKGKGRGKGRGKGV